MNPERSEYSRVDVRRDDPPYTGRDYAMWLSCDESRRVGVDTTSYGYIPLFSELSEPNQRCVAEIVAAKGQHAVKSADIGDFVREHRIPVAGVERTVQTAQLAH